jgi:hypothetical protein
MQLQRLYHYSQLEFHVFSDSESATAWLNSLLAQAKLQKNKQQKKDLVN